MTNPLGIPGLQPKSGYGVPDPTKKDLFSLRWHKLLARRVNSLVNLIVQRGQLDGPLIIGDAGPAILQLAQGGSGGSGTGGLNWRGLYSALTDYSPLDAVYTNPGGSTRIAWVAELDNGPAAGTHAPTWPEPVPVFWRAMGYFDSSGVEELSFESWGYGGNNDYITCSGQKVHLPPLLRFAQPSPRVARGIPISFSAYDSTNQTRLASIGANSITQYITPAYCAGDIIYAASIGGALQDLNVDGRVFAGPSA